MATKKTSGTAVSKAAAFDYAPAPESRSIVDIKASYGLFINGEFVDGTGTRFKTINPANEEVLAEVSEASEADVDAAVKARSEEHTSELQSLLRISYAVFCWKIKKETRHNRMKQI